MKGTKITANKQMIIWRKTLDLAGNCQLIRQVTYSPPFGIPRLCCKGFYDPCYNKPTFLSSASDLEPIWKRRKSEFKGQFCKNHERSKCKSFRGSSWMYKDSSFSKSSWWLPLQRNYGWEGEGRSLGLNSGFVKGARSRRCLRKSFIISEKV